MAYEVRVKLSSTDIRLLFRKTNSRKIFRFALLRANAQYFINNIDIIYTAPTLQWVVFF